MDFFSGCRTIEELKKQYKKLSLKHHPDKGGSNEVMARINAAYDELFKKLKDIHNATADENHQCRETPEEFREIVNILSGMDGLEIELCGSWLWIGGNTMVHKDRLKAAGCKWASQKKMWYWHPAEQKGWRSKSRTSMTEIRAKYGSMMVRGNRFAAIEA